MIKRQQAYLLVPYKFHTPAKLPKKYNISKQHKEGWRPICAAPAFTTTHLSKVLTIIFTALIDVIKEDAHLYYLLHGICTFFDIDTAKDVRERLEELNIDPQHTPNKLDTADIDDWYNKMPHFLIKKTIRQHIPEIYKRKGKLYIIAYKKTYKWTNQWVENDFNVHCISSHDAVRLLLRRTWGCPVLLCCCVLPPL